MKNLKKVLALVMAFACAFTMFAGAAINDFSDKADIKNQDAVSMLTALNVIEGYSDGTFLPNGNVTRAQMAKMIYTIRSGGSTDATIYEDVSTTFTDVNGTWGAGFVKYCQTNQIIAGKSDTVFDPNGNVTVAETAKMALVVLGYRADKAVLTGANWQKNTIALADDNKLLDGVTTSVTSPATRDDAAQILYNLLDADAVVWSNDKEEFIKDTVTVGKDGSTSTSNRTAGEKYLGLKKTVGILSTVEKTDGASTYEISISSVDKDESSSDYLTDFTKVGTDYSQYKYQQVKVLYKEKNEVYGVYPTNKNTGLSGVLGNFEIDNGKLKFNSTKYTIDSSATVNVDGSAHDDKLADFIGEETDGKDGYLKEYGLVARAFDAVAVSKTDSSKINEMNVESFAVAKVTYVSSSYINVEVKVENEANSTKINTKLTDSDATWPSDLAKDDYVSITPSNNTTSSNLGVKKLDTVTGKVTSVSNKGEHNQKITIGETEYTFAMGVKDGPYNTDGSTNEIGLNNTVSIVVKNGYVIHIDDYTAVADDVLLVVETGKTSGVGSKYNADVLLADGSRETVEIRKINGELVADYMVGITNEDYDIGPVLASFSKSSNKYDLTIVNDNTTASKAGYDKFETVTKNNIKSSKFEQGSEITSISSDATVYVAYSSNDEIKYSVITGSALKNWSSSQNFSSQAISSATNGIQTAKVAFVDRASYGGGLPGGSGVTYGYIFKARSVTSGGNDYTEYDIWNGTTTATIRTEDSTSAAKEEGTVVSYSVNSDGIATMDVMIGKGQDKEWTLGAVTGWEGIDKMDGTIVAAVEKGSDYDLLDGTEDGEAKFNIDYDDEEGYVLFIDTDDKTGATSYSPRTASKDSNGDYIANAAFWTDGNKTIVVIDTQNKIIGSKFNSESTVIPVPVK